MKFKEMLELSSEDLLKKVKEGKEELFNLRFQSAANN